MENATESAAPWRAASRALLRFSSLLVQLFRRRAKNLLRRRQLLRIAGQDAPDRQFHRAGLDRIELASLCGEAEERPAGVARVGPALQDAAHLQPLENPRQRARVHMENLGHP